MGRNTSSTRIAPLRLTEARSPWRNTRFRFVRRFHSQMHELLRWPSFTFPTAYTTVPSGLERMKSLSSAKLPLGKET